MTVWIWQVKMVGGEVREIEAEDAQFDSGYWHFVNRERFKLQSESAGFWPWSGSTTVVRETTRQIWVTTINADHVIEVTPISEVEEEEVAS